MKNRSNEIHNLIMNTRITEEQNSFGYINERGIFEKRDLVQHLRDLGVWEEPTGTDKRGLSPELTAYYDKLKQTIESLK